MTLYFLQESYSDRRVAIVNEARSKVAKSGHELYCTDSCASPHHSASRIWTPIHCPQGHGSFEIPDFRSVL